jgi:hypothetical protein
LAEPRVAGSDDATVEVEMESDESWLRTSLETEAVKGLRACRRHLADGLIDAYELKWAALAVTTSLQSFIVSTYRSVELATWDEAGRRGLEEYERGERSTPPSASEVHLPAFLALCEKLRDEQEWKPTSETWSDLERLRDLRDAFMHFRPRGWSIEAPHLRAAVRAALEAIAYIIEKEPGDFRWYDEQLQRAAIAELPVARRLATEAP